MTTTAVGLVWDMTYRAPTEVIFGALDACSASFLLAAHRAHRLRRLRASGGRGGGRRGPAGNGGAVRAPPGAGRASNCQAQVHVTALTRLVPRRPRTAVSYDLPPRRPGRPRWGTVRGNPIPAVHRARYAAVGHRARPVGASCAALPSARYPERVVGAIRLRRRADPAVRDARPRPRWPRSSSRTGRSRLARLAGRLREGARGDPKSDAPYQVIVALEAWLRTSRA